MITKIEVNGFKSLKDFNLNLHQGLNILVGPNGAGKTNIILFFEFLSNLTRNQVGNAISHVGGAGTIFQKIGREQYGDKIICKIFGSYQTASKKFITYEYSFTIKISFEKDIVYFEEQQIKMRIDNKFIPNPDLAASDAIWDLDIAFSASDDGKSVLVINSFDQKKMKPRYFQPTTNTLKGREKFIKDIILSQSPKYSSILKSLFLLTEFSDRLNVDLIGGETFNVVPTKVRELEDSATPPGIKKDGSGLATTLYAMKKSRTKQSEHVLPFWYPNEEPQKSYDPQTLNKIISFLKAANSTISALDVDNDPFNNKLVVKVTIKTGDYEAVLPLSSMSDGTVKWLALITAILTSKTIFSIEEPENFLHPWMQAEIAKIMRNHLLEKKIESFVLMTTHSESLLNHSNPEEIIIVDLKDGKTVAKRISNLALIKEEISNSGFGLGYFYFSNALNDE